MSGEGALNRIAMKESLDPDENVHLVGEIVPLLGKKSLHVDHLCGLTLLPLHLNIRVNNS